MAEWMKYFENEPDFGMDFLMMVPDHCVFFLMLMICLICVLSIREKVAGSEDVYEGE